MSRFFLTITCAALSTAVLTTSPVLAAGKADRARAAIAEAKGKVAAAEQVGAGGEASHLKAQAAAMLRQAQQDLASGHKEQAFDDANRASQLADTAIGAAQHAKVEAERAQRATVEATAANARPDAAAANARADAAQRQASRYRRCRLRAVDRAWRSRSASAARLPATWAGSGRPPASR